MGTCFSSKRSEVPLETIRVVHLDGSLEDYEDPTTVDQVVSAFPKHFLCTPIQILQNGLTPLRLDHQLETGQIYIMLPNSTLKFNASPTELSFLTKKLTNIAKTQPKSVPTSCPLWDSEAGRPKMEKMGSVYKSPSWKPLLATIREGSFNPGT